MSSTVLTRRSAFLAGVTALSLPGPAESENVYRFETATHTVRLTFEYWDNYNSSAMRFRERMFNHPFCLAPDGQEVTDCPQDFKGSLAIAHYQVHLNGTSASEPCLREMVRDIDRSATVPARRPFERTIPLQQGIASDVQVFGYSDSSAALGSSAEVWWLARQDLYLDQQSVPFLVLHWRHQLDGIRVLDMLPGPGTRQVFLRDGRKSKKRPGHA